VVVRFGGGGAAGERAEGGVDVGRVLAVERLHLLEGEPSGGERAGRVGAHDVDVADRLDGVDLLHPP
jgi:hypothetical protein